MEQTTLERAKELIDAYFVREFGIGATADDFSDLDQIPLVWSTTPDGLSYIGVFCDLVNYRVDTYWDEFLFRRVQCDSLEEMAENVLPSLSAKKLSTITIEDCQELEERLIAARLQSAERDEASSFSVIDALDK